jgi:NAD(P)-dependent dehydrogenase (short-subunit alcohol dehydrogenase family)
MAPAELFDLTGKVAVITGGAGGIGVVYARALCEAGASVVIADVAAGAAEQAVLPWMEQRGAVASSTARRPAASCPVGSTA